jgi:hypothetical protein
MARIRSRRQWRDGRDRHVAARICGCEQFAYADAFLLGRGTYDLFKAYWPSVEDPNDPVASKLRNKPKYVVSDTVTRSDWSGSHFISDPDTVEEIRNLKTLPGGDLQVHEHRGIHARVHTHRPTPHRRVRHRGRGGSHPLTHHSQQSSSRPQPQGQWKSSALRGLRCPVRRGTGCLRRSRTR